MQKFLKSMAVAGALACAALSAGPAAAGDAGVQFEKLQQSGADIRFTQFNALSGAATGGGIPTYRGQGYGYSRGGYGHRGFRDRGYGGRGYYGRRDYGHRYGYGRRRW